MSSIAVHRFAAICGLLLFVETVAEPNWGTSRRQAHAQAPAAAKSKVQPPAAARTDAPRAAAAPAQGARAEERAAIRAVMESFAKAFESGDAKALAAHWTSDGEYQNEFGATVRGRDALEQAFAAFFAKTPEVTAEVHAESLRFLSSDSGIEEGTVTIRRGAAEGATDARYSALFVREDGKWQLAQLRESSGDEVSIADLGWLIGEWKSAAGSGAEIHSTYSWDAHKKFIHVRFTIKEGDLALSGSQVIGVDPATGGIHTWTFEADGGVGESDWTRDGDHWVLDLAGTLSDGSTLTETNVLRRINDDTLTWQSVDRLLDDEKIADLAPVKVTRIKHAK